MVFLKFSKNFKIVDPIHAGKPVQPEIDPDMEARLTTETIDITFAQFTQMRKLLLSGFASRTPHVRQSGKTGACIGGLTAVLFNLCKGGDEAASPIK